MAAFLYYLPGLNGVDLDGLAAHGLAYAFEAGMAPSVRHVERGPDPQRGIVIADARHAARVGYFGEAEQHWRRVPGSSVNGSAAWVGMERAGPAPGPAELQRSRQISGHAVEMGDGRHWLCPVARGLAALDDGGDGLSAYCALPTRIDCDESGSWIYGAVDERFDGLWKIACAYFDSIARASAEAGAGGTVLGGLSFDFAGRNDAAAAALGANYRIGRAEIGLLGLFNDRSVQQVLGALIDWPTFEAWLQKKTPSAGSSTVAGPPGGMTDTGPA